MPRTDVTQMAFAKLYPLLVNKAEKKGRTRAEVDQVTAWLTGYTPEDIAKLRAPDFCGRIGYPAYALQNNNANIRRIRGRIAELKKRTESTPEGWEFDGGRVVVNTAENRLQIIFDGKPNADVRTELKGEGFRWAPSQGAWQRQLTDNAMRAARRLKCIAPQV